MSDDLIRRSDAIRTVCECECYSGDNPCAEGKGCYAVNELRKIPPADRPHGKWIRDDIGTLICSECKRPRRDSRIGHTNFCNSCGADMREGETGEQVLKI